jgi:hypothetical protein
VRPENRIVIPILRPAGKRGDTVQVQFACGIPRDINRLTQNYFCLLVRLENDRDSSQISDGGTIMISAKNNMAMRNVYETPPGASYATMAFDIIGSRDHDGLLIERKLQAGEVRLGIPVEALPWRNAALIEQSGVYRGDTDCTTVHPLHNVNRTYKGAIVRDLTDITGAASLELQNGIATLVMESDVLHVPSVHLDPGVRMPASVEVNGAVIDQVLRHVHVAQLSGGHVIGGVSLELQ